MKAATLEHAQSRMRLKNQTHAKGEVAAERSATTLVSDLMAVAETAQYLRVSLSQLYSLTRTEESYEHSIRFPCFEWALGHCGSANRLSTNGLRNWRRWQGETRTAVTAYGRLLCGFSGYGLLNE